MFRNYTAEELLRPPIPVYVRSVEQADARIERRRQSLDGRSGYDWSIRLPT
jgi:hypothetical protein